MYKYESALCLEKQFDAQWKTVDISTVKVYTLFNKYIKVFLTLTNPVIEGNIYVDLDTLRDDFKTYDGTIQVLLNTLDNRFLKGVAALPNSKVNYVSYSDALYAGYKVDTTIIGKNTAGYLPTELKDLKITRPNYATDMMLLHTHALVTVNGYLHQTDARTDGSEAYVVNGRHSLQKSRQNQVGILNFHEIGKITKEAIKPANLYAQENGFLKDRAYIHVETDMTNKTVLLSLGGYLIFPQSGVFWQSDSQTVALNMSALPMLERLVESSIYLDLSSLGLSINSKNPDIVNAAEFFSNDVLKKYFALSQTFLIIVDTPSLFTEKFHLKHCNLPGSFTAYQEPKFPLFVNYGKMAEYWKTEEDGFWSVNVQDSFIRNFVFTYRPEGQLKNITSNAVPTRTFKHSNAFLLEIGAYK